MDKPITATAYAIEEIKRLIVERELAPGERIDQSTLAERLGLSRLPVRQALTHLAGQRFVQLRDHRSAMVPPISGKDMRDLYDFRIQLERWGFERSFERLRSDEVLARLNKVLERTEAAVDAGDHALFLRINRDFHFTLYDAIDNAYVAERARSMFDISERYHWLCTGAPGMMPQSLSEHRQMVADIAAGELKQFLSHSESHNKKTIKWVEDHGEVDLPHGELQSS